jgi:hypothetical protein
VNGGPLAESLLPVIEAFDRLGIRYHIGGSVASSVFGTPRATMDVDLIADLRLPHGAALEAALSQDYYVDAESIREAVRTGTSFNLIHYEHGVKIDVFVLQRQPFDLEAFGRARPVRLQQIDASPELQVASPEDTVLQKLRWYRMGGQTSERQWNDVLGVLAHSGADLDVGYMRHWAKELQVDDLLEEALDEAGLTGPDAGGA